MQSIQRSLRTYRNEIKGFAILWVVFFHAQLGIGGILYDVQKIGYGGVDIFFFLSGFGLFHSLSRNADPADYLLRRAQRLLPAYLPFCLIWLAVMIPMNDLGLAGALRTVMGNLFMVGYFSQAPVQINWYPSALLLSLVLAPLFYGVLKSHTEKRAPVMIAALLMMGIAFVGSDLYMVVSRLPVFAAGMMAAGWKSEKPGKGTLTAMLAAGCVLGMAALMICYERYAELLSTYAMYWHPFLLIAPAMCAGLGWLFSLIPQKALAPLRLLGKASFEIFLFNAWVELLGKYYDLCEGRSQWLFWSAISVVLGVLYHLAVQWTASQKMKKTQKRG